MRSCPSIPALIDDRLWVVKLPFQRGVAMIDRSIAMETGHVAVSASGELNLVAQTASLRFRPMVKKGVGLSTANLAQLVKVEVDCTIRMSVWT